MTIVRIPAPTTICFSIALASSCLVYAGGKGTVPNLESVIYSGDLQGTFLVSASIETNLIVDSKAKKWFKFQALAKQWQLERGAMSSITEMSILPSYQKIIGMGEDAIPLILARLRSEGDEPDQWFWALRSLTDVNPVKEEDQGDFQAMAQAWLAWGESEEYAA